MNLAVSKQQNLASHNEAIEHIKACADSHLPSFLSAYSLISPEAAQLGWLLQFFINKACNQHKGYKTFFANSGLEALHGAIKLLKHSNNSQNQANAEILLVSNNLSIQTVFPDNISDSDKSLYPGLVAITESDIKLAMLEQPRLTGIVYSPARLPSIELYNSLIMHCHQHGLKFILDTSQCLPEQIYDLLGIGNHTPDIIVWGESICQGAIPFGAFTANDEIYQVWNNLPNCLIHSSTFGGNNLALSFALKRLVTASCLSDHTAEIGKTLKQISHSNSQTTKYFTDHVNPYSGLLFKITKMDPLFDYADGMTLACRKTDKPLEILDCLGGGGCNVKGHNPKDFAAQLQQTHIVEKDYWYGLSEKLKSLTNLDDAFPAVSGASAVEIALSLGLKAQTSKKTLITFNGNYAGKSLVSLSATGMPSMRAPFEPLYPNVVFIDPKGKDACRLLNQELDKGDTALIWFEYMQGIDNTVIDDKLIDIINKRKASDGYFVGIDEILNGLYRTGEFISPGNKITPDIITFSKGLSGMLIPVAACLVNETISKNIQISHKQLYSFYKTHYINQVGAHVACIVLDYLEQQNIQSNVQEIGHYLKSELFKLSGPDKLLKDVKGHGLNLYLQMNDNVFPLNLFSKITTIGRPMGSMMFTHICMTRGKLLPFFNRFTPPLNCTKAQADEIVKRLEHIIAINRWHLLLIGLRQIGLIWWVNTTRKLKNLLCAD